MTTAMTELAPRAGRPREFEMDSAMEGALRVFRERGYHATSMGDLSRAMKLTTGSIYKAFSDKRAIYLDAFDRYTGGRQAKLEKLIEMQESGIDKVRAVLHFYASSSFGTEGQMGCLVVGGATQLSTFDAEISARITSALQRVEVLLLKFVHLGQQDGSLNPDLDARSSARALACFMQGLRVVGKTKPTSKQVLAAADRALRMLN